MEDRSHVQTVPPLDLVTYARRHRLRVRNLHDGYPVPPARLSTRQRRSTPRGIGYFGESDRLDAVVGYDGYLNDEGHTGLGIYLHFKSAKGVNRAASRIEEMGGRIRQFGGTEIAGAVDGLSGYPATASASNQPRAPIIKEPNLTISACTAMSDTCTKRSFSPHF